jgi:transcriptional regulator with XRE-family HTH domain
MARHQQLVAGNVRRFRQERGLSIGELARRAGIAKQTLATIELGQGNPTIDTLALLGEALDVSLRRLLTEWGTPVHIQRASAASWAEHPNRTERLLSEVYGSGYVRTLVLRLRHQGARPDEIAPHGPGALHHLYVMSGRVKAGPLTELVELGPGDFARYPADVPHAVEALTDEAVALIVSSEPQLRQTPPPGGA